MFGSHLSKTAAKKAQKPKAAAELPKNVFDFLAIQQTMKSMSLDEHTMTGDLNDFLVGTNDHPHKDALPSGTVPIEYKSDNSEPLSRDQIYGFWKACGSMLLDLKIIRKIVEQSEATSRPLHLAAIDFQRTVMENNFGIEPDYGCQQMGMAAMTYPDDKELQNGASGFMRVAMHSFVEQLKVRASIRTIKGIQLRTTGGFTRSQLLEFFEGCNSVMTLKSTQVELKNCFKKYNDVKALGKICIDCQHQVLELMGVTIEHGLATSNSVMQRFQNDKEIQNKFNSFRMCAELSARLTSMNDVEKDDFLDEVPIYMRDVPHIYFIQKQRIMEQQAQQQQQQAVDQMKQSPELMALQTKLLEFLNTDDGHDKVTNLTKRLSNNKEVVQNRVSKWTDEERTSYFEKFSKLSFIEDIKNAGGDMVQRIETFTALSDNDIEGILTMQCTFNSDARAGGSLLTKLRSEENPSSEVAGVSNVMQSIGAIHRMSSLPKGQKLEMPPQVKGGGHTHDHNHDHGHSHDHGHACNHAGDAKAPDVTSGRVDKIER